MANLGASSFRSPHRCRSYGAARIVPYGGYKDFAPTELVVHYGIIRARTWPHLAAAETWARQF